MWSPPLSHGGEKVASIRNRNGLWQAKLRSRKIGSTSKSFHRKADAVGRAKIQEALCKPVDGKN